MKISVVMPVYNAERHLRFSVGSVLNQTHGDWELVCVDDGSTDSSGAILDEYAAKDARIRIVHVANGGVSVARNAGMDVASGDLVTFLDADDRLHPEALRIFCGLYGKSPYELLRYVPRPVTSPTAPFETITDLPKHETVDYAACGESPFRYCALGWATVVARKLAESVRWCGLEQGEDMVFVMDCLLKTKATVRTAAPLANYLLDPDSASRRMSVGLLRGTCEYLPIMLDRADRLGMTPAARTEAEYLVRDLLLRRLFGSWRKLRDHGERRIVAQAFWSTVRKLSERPSFFGPLPKSLFRLACRRENAMLLGLSLVLPYRLKRNVRR